MQQPPEPSAAPGADQIVVPDAGFPPRRAKARAWVGPLMVFVLALALRLSGLDWGLPTAERWYSYHPDESVRQLVGAVALHLMQGDFNPHFFNYPSLAIYATFATHQILSGLGIFASNPPGPYPWEDIRNIILAGRFFTAVCGAATATLVLLLARKLNMGAWALWAGVVMALVPGHLQHSHFATVDVPATFFVVLCLYLTARAQSWRGLAVAALVAGLAASTKYNAGLVLVAPLAAVLVPGLLRNSAQQSGEPASALPGPKLVITPLLVLLSGVGFLLGTPYAVLAFPDFWGDGKANGLAYELLVHPREGSGELFQNTGNGWWYHLAFNLPYLMTWPLALAGVAGAWTARKDRFLWPLLAFLVVYFVVTGSSEVRFMRYLIPLSPLLVLLAAYWVKGRKTPRILGTVLLPCAVYGAACALSPLVSVDPRDRALEVIRWSGKQPVIVGNPWFYTPAFQPRGDNVPVPEVTSIHWNPAAFDPATQVLVISEYEVREALRLRPNGPEFQFLKAVTGKADSFRIFGNHFAAQSPVTPGPYVPHDYLYTFPGTMVIGDGLDIVSGP